MSVILHSVRSPDRPTDRRRESYIAAMCTNADSMLHFQRQLEGGGEGEERNCECCGGRTGERVDGSKPLHYVRFGLHLESSSIRISNPVASTYLSLYSLAAWP